MGFLSNLFTKTPDSILLESAKSGRLEKVISALADGASIETKDKVMHALFSSADIKFLFDYFNIIIYTICRDNAHSLYPNWISSTCTTGGQHSPDTSSDQRVQTGRGLSHLREGGSRQHQQQRKFIHRGVGWQGSLPIPPYLIPSPPHAYILSTFITPYLSTISYRDKSRQQSLTNINSVSLFSYPFDQVGKTLPFQLFIYFPIADNPSSLIATSHPPSHPASRPSHYRAGGGTPPIHPSDGVWAIRPLSL